MNPLRLWYALAGATVVVAVLVFALIVSRAEPPQWAASVAFLPFFGALYIGLAGLVLGIIRYRRGEGRGWLRVAAMCGLAFAIVFAAFFTHFPAGSQ